MRKQVRFSETDGRGTSLSETLTSQKIETPLSETTVNHKKKKKRKKTQLQILKAEKKKLKGDLKDTRKGILEDNERKASPDYTPYENRQRLARTTSDNLSNFSHLTIIRKRRLGTSQEDGSLGSKVCQTYKSKNFTWFQSNFNKGN